MKNANDDEVKMKNIYKNQDMVIKHTVDDLIEKLKEKELLTDALNKCTMLSHMALLFS